MPRAQDPYTVVQHSGFGYRGDPTFARGLETRAVSSVAVRKRVERAGGVIFDDYGSAEEFAEAAMYPDGSERLVPHAAGEFAESVVDGLRIYVPVRAVIG